LIRVTDIHIQSYGFNPEQASVLAEKINAYLNLYEDTLSWQHISIELLKPEYPFAFHQFLYKTVYQMRNHREDPGPGWIPSDRDIQNTHIAQSLSELNLINYQDFHRWSIEHIDAFWSYVIKKLSIRFEESEHPKGLSSIDLTMGPEYPVWFPLSRLNIVESCFQADPEAIAIIYRDKNIIKTMTYGQLEKLVNRVANGLKQLSYEPGTALAIDMPMHPNAVAIYLGIIKAGHVMVAIADSFTPNEIATRLRIANAKGIFTEYEIHRSGKTLPLYEKIIAANAPKAIVLGCDSNKASHLRQEDITWESFLDANEQFTSIMCEPDQACTILFSSGTTAEPKAIPWTHTTPIKSAMDAYFHHDIHANDVLAWPTNLGWMMGPWLVFAALINRATMALFDDVPTTRAFGQFVEEAKVTMLGLVPSLVKTWHSSRCMEGLNWSAIKAFSSSGECSNPDDMLYLMSLAGYKPIIEYCGGTEIGGAYITSTLVQANIPSLFSTPTLGLNFVLLNENGEESREGEIALIPPSIGLSLNLLNNDHHYIYYENMPLTRTGKILRRHGDQLEHLVNGYFRALGRADDTMNLGGIKISAVEIERQLALCDDVYEVAAIASNPPEGGPSQLIIYAKPNPQSILGDNELKKRLQQLINTTLNPLFKIYELILVEILPRTASNKLMRRTLRDSYEKGKK
jgi:acetyl-CoA synthetase